MLGIQDNGSKLGVDLGTMEETISADILYKDGPHCLLLHVELASKSCPELISHVSAVLRTSSHPSRPRSP